MLKESRVHLEPLSEKVQKIRQEAKRAKELREKIGHAVGLGGRIMNKSITPEVAAQARDIGDSMSLLNQLCKFSHKYLKFYPQILSKNEP